MTLNDLLNHHQDAFNSIHDALESMRKTNDASARYGKEFDWGAFERNHTAALVFHQLAAELLTKEINSRVRIAPEAPKVGSLWTHSNGNVYRVTGLTNTETECDRYPVTVVYQNVNNGAMWSRALSDWYRSFTPKDSATALRTFIDREGEHLVY